MKNIIKEKKLFFVDIETFSSEDLVRKGVYKYASHESTEILMMAYACPETDFQSKIIITTHKEGEEEAKRLLNRHIEEGYTFIAHSAEFEVTLFSEVWKIDLPLFRVEDTKAFGKYLNLSDASLKGMAIFLGGEQKMEEGKDLIKMFSVPQRSGYRITELQAPDEWATFVNYCLQDVNTLVSIYQKIRKIIPPHEVFLQSLTLWENITGLTINLPFLEQALLVEEMEFSMLTDFLKDTLKINNPRSLAQVKGALKALGYEGITSLAKDNLPIIVEKYPELREIVEGVATLNSKTSAKFRACRDRMVGNKIKGCLMYGGTVSNRWSSVGLQIHNFCNKGVPTELKALLDKGEYSKITSLADVNNAVRALIIPRKGHIFIDADFAQIEARLMAAYSKSGWKIDTFNSDGDIYAAAAGRMFGVQASTCEKKGSNARLRQSGKICELALQYGGGWSAIDKSIQDEEKSKELVRRWRSANSDIMDYRREILDGVYDVLRNPSLVLYYNDGLVRLSYTGGLGLNITIKTILGIRSMFFNNLEATDVVEKYVFHNADGEPIRALAGVIISKPLYDGLVEGMITGQDFTFEFNNKFYDYSDKILKVINKKDEKLLHKTSFYMSDDSYEAKSIINKTTRSRFEYVNPIIQGSARDCLGYSMKNLTLMGYPPLFHVHDELIVECKESEKEYVCSLIRDCMNYTVMGVKIKATPEYMTYFTK